MNMYVSIIGNIYCLGTYLQNRDQKRWETSNGLHYTHESQLKSRTNSFYVCLHDITTNYLLTVFAYSAHSIVLSCLKQKLYVI